MSNYFKLVITYQLGNEIVTENGFIEMCDIETKFVAIRTENPNSGGIIIPMDCILHIDIKGQV